MDEAKKTRTWKARVVTRRTNELLNSMKCKLQEEEIVDKINNLKYALTELGTLHDDVIGILEERKDGDEKEKLIEAEEQWYDVFDKKVNLAVKEGRTYIDDLKDAAKSKVKLSVKVKKLEVPTFKSDPKSYHRWKETFLRYTSDFDDAVRYDYLHCYTEGDAHRYVSNRRTFADAMQKLDEKFGNINEIVGMLIDDIKAIPVVRKGDFKAFERLSLQVNDFHDRLVLMGKQNKVENSYILKEVESKLCTDDLLRWLESEGDQVDHRKVENLLKWLEKQTRLRRICERNASLSSLNHGYHRPCRTNGVTSNPVAASSPRCNICKSDHLLENCPFYLRLPVNKRWKQLKSLRVCFICLRSGHRRCECTSQLCEVCSRPHHTTLHKDDNVPRNPTAASSVCSNPAYHHRAPKRCFLPVVQMRLENGDAKATTKAVLDSGSELSIITPEYCEKLKLKGVPTKVMIVGAGGVTTTMSTKLVQVNVIDKFGVSTLLDCVVLRKACGEALPIDARIIKDCKTNCKIDVSKFVTQGGRIDLLVGMSSPMLHRQIDMMEINNGLAICYTRFGPCLVGSATCETFGNYARHVNSVMFSPEPEHSSTLEEDPTIDVTRTELTIDMDNLNENITQQNSDTDIKRRYRSVINQECMLSNSFTNQKGRAKGLKQRQIASGTSTVISIWNMARMVQ